MSHHRSEDFKISAAREDTYYGVLRSTENDTILALSLNSCGGCGSWGDAVAAFFELLADSETTTLLIAVFLVSA